MTKCAFLTIVLSFFLSAQPALSDDPARGRLPDGRAYRTDQSGTQLVDYIAELEVNLDTLNRKVRGLEDELKEKQRALEQAGVKDASGGKIAEKNLTGEAVPPSHDEFKIASSGSAAPQPQLFKQDACEMKVADLERGISQERERRTQEVSDLNTLVSRLQTSLRARDAAAIPAASHSDGSSKEMKAEIDRVTLALRTAQEDLEIEKKDRVDDAVKYKQTIAAMESKLSQRDSDLEQTRDKLDKLEHERKSEATLVALKSKESEAAEKTRAAYREEAPTRLAEPPPVIGSYSSAPVSLVEARERAIDSIRGTLSQDLKNVRNMVEERDDLFSKYGGRGKSVQFRPTQPVSSRNRSLDVIRKQIEIAGSVNELASLRSDLNEIRKKMDDDILLIKRMNKVG